MLLKICFLAAMLLPALSAAQPSDATAPADCRAEIATLDKGVDEARAKGQMLRRRQLAEALAALQAECRVTALLPAPAERAAAIESLEADIRQLRIELERAESQLRRLKDESS